MNIVFIGSSSIGLKYLSESNNFSVSDVLCLRKRVTNELNNIAQELGHKIKLFDWIKDFRTLINSYDESTPFFIYQLDMLVPASLTNRYSFYNLHRGNLKTNRGPNPDIWPILLGHDKTSMSLHKINDKIDAGVLIDTYDVEISPEDNTDDVKIKLEKGLPKLVESTFKYISGEIEGEEIKDGNYRPWVTENDFTIDLAKDTIEIIKRKIRSQKQYNGAILIKDNQKKYVIGVHSRKPINSNKIIEVRLKTKSIFLEVNENPLFSPPPKFPAAKRI